MGVSWCFPVGVVRVVINKEQLQAAAKADTHTTKEEKMTCVVLVGVALTLLT